MRGMMYGHKTAIQTTHVTASSLEAAAHSFQVLNTTSAISSQPRHGFVRGLLHGFFVIPFEELGDWETKDP